MKRPNAYRSMIWLMGAALVLVLGYALTVILEVAVCRNPLSCSAWPWLPWATMGCAAVCIAVFFWEWWKDVYKGKYERDLARWDDTKPSR